MNDLVMKAWERFIRAVQQDRPDCPGVPATATVTIQFVEGTLIAFRIEDLSEAWERHKAGHPTPVEGVESTPPESA